MRSPVGTSCFAIFPIAFVGEGGESREIERHGKTQNEKLTAQAATSIKAIAGIVLPEESET